MPVISFPTERVFNSATFMREHIAFAAVRYFLKMGHAQINVRTRACSRTFIVRWKQAALTLNIRGKELNWSGLNQNIKNDELRRNRYIPKLTLKLGQNWRIINILMTLKAGNKSWHVPIFSSRDRLNGWAPGSGNSRQIHADGASDWRRRAELCQ